MKFDEQFMADYCVVNAPHMIPRVADWICGEDETFTNDLAQFMEEKLRMEITKLRLWRAIANMTDETFAA